jgi:antitoxin component of MazEF toxin-antitoxin module
MPPSATAAEGIVAALAIPELPASGQVRPLSLPDLHALPRDGSLVHGFGRIDASGRIASRPVTGALHWQPGDRLEVTLAAGAIIMHASPAGLLQVPPRPAIIIPAHARRRCGLKPGDHVLLAAAPGHALVIIYPPAALDEMIAGYHGTRSDRSTPDE